MTKKPLDLNPKTRPVEVHRLRVGDIVCEQPDEPARITRLSVFQGNVHIWARFVWTPADEPDWDMGYFARDYKLQKAI